MRSAAWAAAPDSINPQTPSAAARIFFILTSPPPRSPIASKKALRRVGNQTIGRIRRLNVFDDHISSNAGSTAECLRRLYLFNDRRIIIADARAVHAPGHRPFAQRALGGRPQRVRAE